MPFIRAAFSTSSRSRRPSTDACAAPAKGGADLIKDSDVTTFMADVIDASRENVVARVRELTGGKGVPVVYDGVGQATLMISLDCLSPRGLLVSFGNASGPVKALDLGLLAARGSLYVTRPLLMTYTASDADLHETARDVVEMVKSGKVAIPVNQRYALSEAVKAHEDLEARRTTGTTILIPP